MSGVETLVFYQSSDGQLIFLELKGWMGPRGRWKSTHPKWEGSNLLQMYGQIFRDFPCNSALFGLVSYNNPWWCSDGLRWSWNGRVFQIIFSIAWIYPRTKAAMVTTRIIAFVVWKSYELAFTTVACSRGWSSTHDHSRGLQTHYKDFEGSMTMSLHSHFWPCHSGGVFFKFLSPIQADHKCR